MFTTPAAMRTRGFEVHVVPDAALAAATGSQIGPRRVIWVVGAQKIVPDLETALRRIPEHCLPLEDERARNTYGRGSATGETLVVEREVADGRITVVLVHDALGF